MPADANLFCEYYMLSNLTNNKKFKSSSVSVSSSSSSSLSPTNTKLLKLKSNSESNLSIITSSNNNNKNINNNSSKSTDLFFNDTIDFVKYDKNPMDYLKSKYQLLNTTTTNNQQTINKTSLSLNSLNNLSNGQVAATTTVNNSNEKSNNQNNKQSQQSLNKANSLWLDLNWSKIRKIGIGLLNLGNNCYLNATLQCLAYTPPLSQWLITKPHSPTCKFKQAKGFCSLCEVERIIYDIFNSANGFAKPNSLCFNIKKISNVFSVGTQEDASEFFTTLLESMAKSIKFSLNSNQFTSFNPIKSMGQNNNNNKKTCTILDDIFSFQFRSRITCGNCGRLSDTIENTNTWPVDVKYVQDIRKGMLHFLREEVLEGENAYKCEKCNKKTRATKKYSIRTAPNILVIHLKRFDFSYAGKLSHYVSYPEILSLKTFIPETTINGDANYASAAASAAASACNQNESNLSSNKKSLRNVSYKLYGVLVHLGYTSQSGHYYSYVRGPNDVWYKADDQRISVVQLRDALAQHAYILFYSKLTNNSNIVSTEPTSVASSASIPLVNQPKQNIPNIIKNEPSKIVEPKLSTTNYLNSLNLSEPSQSSTTVQNQNKISIKLKTVSPTLNSSKDQIATTSKNESSSKLIYGPVLPTNFINNTSESLSKLVDKEDIKETQTNLSNNTINRNENKVKKSPVKSKKKLEKLTKKSSKN